MPDDEKLAKTFQAAENRTIKEINEEFKASVHKTVAETDWSEIEQRLMHPEPGRHHHRSPEVARLQSLSASRSRIL